MPPLVIVWIGQRHRLPAAKPGAGRPDPLGWRRGGGGSSGRGRVRWQCPPGGVQPTGQPQGEGELEVLPVPAAPGEGEGGKDVAVLQGDLGLLHLHLGFRQAKRMPPSRARPGSLLRGGPSKKAKRARVWVSSIKGPLFRGIIGAAAARRPRRWLRLRSGSPPRGTWGCRRCRHSGRWWHGPDRPPRCPGGWPASPGEQLGVVDGPGLVTEGHGHGVKAQGVEATSRPGASGWPGFPGRSRGLERPSPCSPARPGG